MSATAFTTIASFEVVFFSKDNETPVIVIKVSFLQIFLIHHDWYIKKS